MLAFRRFFAWSLLVLCSCGDCGESEGDLDPVPPTPFEEEDLAFQTMVEMPLDAILVTLDRDGDGDVDADDLENIRECVQDADPSCDLNGDGEIDNADLVVARLWIGEREARSAEVIAEFSNALETFDDDSDLADAIPLLSDFNGDGVSDSDDITILADALDAPATWDKNDDGLVAYDDVWLLADSHATAYFNDESDAPVEGDLLLATTVAHLTTRQQIGILDANYDGRIDVLDFCKVSTHPDQANMLRGLTAFDVADAAFEDATPTTMLCRADGKSILQFPARASTALVWVIKPQNLFVDDAPADLGPEFDVVPPQDTPIFWVTMQETDRQVLEFRMPWTLDSDVAQFSISLSGPEPAQGSLLALPNSLAPLTAPSIPNALSEVPSATLAFFTANEKAARGAFATEFVTMTEAYDQMITDCAGTDLSVERREEPIRFLLAYERMLIETERFAMHHRDIIKAIHVSNLDTHVSLMNASAIGWQQLGSMIKGQWMAESMLLVVDIVKEGNLPKAFTTAASNLIDELTSEDELPVYLTGEGSILEDAFDGLIKSRNFDSVKGAVLDDVDAELVADWLKDADGLQKIKDGFATIFKTAKGVPTKDAMKSILGSLRNSMKENISPFSKEMWQGVMFDIVKNIPKMYVNYQIRSLLESDADAILANGAYNVTAHRLAVWEKALIDVQDAKLEIETLRDRYTTALGDNLDPNLATCVSTLDTELLRIENALNLEVLDARATADAIRENPFFDETALVGTCFHGDAKAALAAVQARGKANFIATIDAQDAGDNPALLGALQAAANAAQEHNDGDAAYAEECRDAIAEFGVSEELLVDYQAQLERIADAGADADAEKDAAWAAFSQCAGGDSLHVSSEELRGGPWQAMFNPLAARPTLPICPVVESWNPMEPGETATVEINGRGFMPTNDSENPAIFFFSEGTEYQGRLLGIESPNGVDVTVVRAEVPIGAASDFVVMRVEVGEAAERIRSAPVELAILPNDGRVFVLGGRLQSILPDAAMPDEMTLVADATNLQNVAVSPTGDRVVYQNRDNWSLVIHAVDSGVTTIVDHPMDNYWTPAFSPDGTEIVFASDGMNGVIMKMNSDGSNLNVLTTQAVQNNSLTPGWPIFSPDGSKIAFVSEDDGVVPPGADVFAPKIYVMNADGSNRALVSGILETERGDHDARPHGWIDDNTILFYDRGTGHFMETDASGLVTPTSLFVQNDNTLPLNEMGSMVISPDGSQVLFRTTCPRGDCNMSGSIWIMDSDGANKRELLPLANETNWPCLSWNPDGNAFAYIQENLGAGTFETRIRTVDGTSDDLIYSAPNTGQTYFECLQWAINR